MKKQRNPLISTFSAHLTSTISVTLVLLVLGVVTLTGIVARNVVRDIRENLGFDVMLVETATDDDITRYKQLFANAVYVDTFEYISNAQAIADLGLEDEDFEDFEFVDENIFPPQFTVKVKEEYANTDSIQAIAKRIEQSDEMVDSVEYHSEMISSINHNIRSITLVLSAIALALMIVSFVLINNTIRLSIYARRFTIHTMKLVGATAGFIRKPFIVVAIIQGLVAGAIAAGSLAALIYSGGQFDESLSALLSWTDTVWVLAGTVVAGVAICLIASLFATNKYLRLDYDEMFK